MKTVIYEDDSSRLEAKLYGDIVLLRHVIQGKVYEKIYLYPEELRKIVAFIDEIDAKKLKREVNRIMNNTNDLK